MMHEKIACLGWGSLIWHPGGLPVRRPWFNDGPLLPIEFARQSDDKRITLVIVPDASPEVARVRSLWALMALGDLESAKQALADREARKEVKPNDIPKFVGFWSKAGTSGQGYAGNIGRWVFEKGLDAVVWTALPYGLKKERNRVPAVDEVISRLKALSDEQKKRAEEYIRKAPRQIDTDYRRRIEMELGWSPISKV